tara:strand:- start:775 stop:1623 length:849 start_codon:yes stop_codon:yes gene_type:complete
MARTEIEIIKDGKVVENDLDTGCVSADKLATDAVLTAKIKNKQVTQEKLADDISFFPTGGIIMWSGQASTIPSGWKLCDGNNGTPDLRGRFIVGASASGGYDPGATGGSNEVTLTEAQLATHKHDITSNGTHGHTTGGSSSTDSAGAHSHGGGTSRQDRNHTHSGSTTENGYHHHPPVTQVGFDNEGNGNPLRILAEDGPPWAGTVWDSGGGSHGHQFTTAGISNDHAHTITTDNHSGHSHPVSLSIAENGAHQHPCENVGSNQPHENRPPYYALAFIMKVA